MKRGIVLEFVNGGVCAAKGFKAYGLHCGIRKNQNKKDLMMIVADNDCVSAAVYTQNLVCGAPITVTKKHLANSVARAVICNSGIANTCSADGIEKAEAMCALAAKAAGCNAEDVIVASTGVIGVPVPLEPIEKAMDALKSGLSYDGGTSAAEAIMTTDTISKQCAVRFNIGENVCTVGGMCKGSGMINPNMATMLCFLSTDVNIDASSLDAALREAVKDTFNMVYIDGDTSTNDMAEIMASGLAGNDRITAKSAGYDEFLSALKAVLLELAKMMAKDGEGATKLIECRVSGAPDEESARKISRSVVSSSLVKTAMFGADANWGRVMCALGYCGAKVDINKVKINFISDAGSINVCKNGAGVDFDEDIAKQILLRDEIVIDIKLYQGKASAVAYGCDLTYDYVKINGDYRS